MCSVVGVFTQACDGNQWISTVFRTFRGIFSSSTWDGMRKSKPDKAAFSCWISVWKHWRKPAQIIFIDPQRANGLSEWWILTPPAGLFLDWRWLAICCSIPPTLLMVLMCFMPETPRFLLSKGKRHEAGEALRFLRGPDAPVEWECARIEDACDEQVSAQRVKLQGRARAQFPPRWWNVPPFPCRAPASTY